ncbi:hypothetical protein NDU88_000270 [Pleurodeles waltl]|uniref:Uncharacterized protein n=1 Tax=Pleurodeles waltl TaxID=8319 RepID=A0AAV7S6H2_PLEWA|nr:hypothetical protein NDU88_000270 [Pleurodeles waltl]
MPRTAQHKEEPVRNTDDEPLCRCLQRNRKKPLPNCPELQQAKRKAVNDRASRTRRAAWRDVRIGDQVVVRDRHLGWKFRTPYEPGVWTCTMVTAAKGSGTVTRNVSWF